MHRVLAHIDQHLSENLSLADLAEVAHFSPFHFHRQFTAWMGETMGEYLRRRRLEVAALRLLTQPNTAVLTIALMVGFGSGEAFARAFKERFACSPSQWRRQKAEERQQQLRKLDQAQRKMDQDDAASDGNDGGSQQSDLELIMDVSVVEREPVRVAYLRHVGPYGASVHKFWEEKFYPMLAQQRLTGRPLFGISHDDPDIAPPDKLRYDTCVAVDEGYVAAGGAQITTIPGGRYASLPFLGTSDTIGPAWMALMRDWLPQSGYQLDDGRPTFEYYPPDATYDAATGTFSCDIVIPLAPL
jgi:AraC family transcriptional regulator